MCARYSNTYIIHDDNMIVMLTWVCDVAEVRKALTRTMERLG